MSSEREDSLQDAVMTENLAALPGKPMLDVLLGEEIRNIVVVVTRYFGGTLLGTGGLVRAYSSSTQAGIRASVIITRIRGLKLNIKTDYNGLGKVHVYFGTTWNQAD